MANNLSGYRCSTDMPYVGEEYVVLAMPVVVLTSIPYGGYSGKFVVEGRGRLASILRKTDVGKICGINSNKSN